MILKIFLKNGIGIECQECANKLEIKEIWKQIKAQVLLENGNKS